MAQVDQKKASGLNVEQEKGCPAKTWVLLNYPDAFATNNPHTARPSKFAWQIIVNIKAGQNDTSWWGPDRKFLSTGRGHATEYKAWKSAAKNLNKVKT